MTTNDRSDHGPGDGRVEPPAGRAAVSPAPMAEVSDADLMRSVLRSSNDCIKVLDLDARLVFMSEGGQRVMEVSDFNAIKGCPWPDFWAGAGNAAAVQAVETAQAGRVGRFQGSAETMAGNLRWWDVQVTPIFGADGRPERLLSISRDITDLVRVEAELREIQTTLEERVRERTAHLLRAEEALRQAQKMEAVGQMTGGVAHDFNNLLTVIKSSTDLLKRPGLSEERRARYVAAISDTVGRAARLTGQLLAFARRQALKPEVFDAVKSVRMIGEMMGTLTGSRIRIDLRLPEAPCFLDADPNQFDTSLVNLVVNARDAMSGEGRLTVAVDIVEIADGRPAVRLQSGLAGRFVAVSVTDTGTGIAPEDVDRIFEPFFTTKQVGQGTGLGLSQVFGFTKQSGGGVSVESRPGEGTTFTLYLPNVEEAETAAETGFSELMPLVDGHGTRVLVVEDNTEVGNFASQTLEELGYSVVWAAGADAALAALAREPDRFDVVFSDVVMPSMNGIELGREIRRLYADLPVVLTSGYSHVLAEDGNRGFELLQKPYSVEDLSQVLRKAAKRGEARRRKGRVGP